MWETLRTLKKKGTEVIFYKFMELLILDCICENWTVNRRYGGMSELGEMKF
jgi:hypothetical protein